jgi:hypothetical protein
MATLDADDQGLRSSRGQVAKRDIVQFVPYSQFARQGIQYLAKEVLAEVPGQVLPSPSTVCCLELLCLLCCVLCVGCWLLCGMCVVCYVVAAGCRVLAAGCCVLCAGCWLLPNTGCLLSAVCCLLTAGNSLPLVCIIPKLHRLLLGR